MQAAFDSAGAGIYLTDHAGRISMANRHAGALLGRPVAEMLGVDAHDLLHRGADDGSAPRSACRLMGVLEHGRPVRGEESTFLGGDGSLLPVSLSAAPILEGGQVLGLIVVFTDITERLNLSREQAGQLAMLEDFNARLTLVTEITSVLTQTLDVDEALQRLGRLLPYFCLWGIRRYGGGALEGGGDHVPPEGAFDVDHGVHGKWAVVHITGDLDWTRSAGLVDTVERFWDSVRSGCLILDLGPTRFCDSSGVSQLIKVFRGCRERDIRLALAAPPAFLQRMLNTTGLIQLFEVHETLEQALTDLDGSEPERMRHAPPV
ncbi:STAS domain-containing protein [Microbispora siamensis]